MKEPIIRNTSVWNATGIERFLNESLIPIRLACFSLHDAPLIRSLWFCYDEDALWCTTQAAALVAKLLRRSAKAGFEVAGDQLPYCSVRGQGRTTLSSTDGAAVLLRLMDRYLGTRDSGFAEWLISRQANEIVIRIEPDWATSWDFSTRMQ
jgi:nitroimidazol reductase NimA-like FMN-containing flavoprotein (pyridoxamine 5'-phosphate oxidase superfamily)